MHHENKFELYEGIKNTIISFTMDEIVSVYYHDGIDVGEEETKKITTNEICYIGFL